MVTAKMAYDLTVSTNLPLAQHSIYSQLWHSNIPQKIKFFVWLVIENKINTQDNLVKKGWNGPNRCCLCKCNVESAIHLFVDCAFARSTISFLHKYYNFSLTQTDTTVQENIENWLKRSGGHLFLPFFSFGTCGRFGQLYFLGKKT